MLMHSSRKLNAFADHAAGGFNAHKHHIYAQGLPYD